MNTELVDTRYILGIKKLNANEIDIFENNESLAQRRYVHLLVKYLIDHKVSFAYCTFD